MSVSGKVKVAIHGVPRSGTSWVGEIVNSSPSTIYRYQPLFSYAHKDFLTNSSTSDDIELFFKRLVECEDEFTTQENNRKNGNFPVFKKNVTTHIAYKEVRYINILFNLMRKTNDLLLCAVIRNPLSVVNSWLNAPREFRKDLGWSALEEWRYALKKNLNRPEEFNGFEKWKEAANIFIQLKKAYPDRVFILRYEQLLSDPIKKVTQLFQFLKLEMNEQTVQFLRESSSCDNQDSYAVFRKKQSDLKWKNELHQEIIKQIKDDLIGTHLETFLCDDIDQ